MGRGGGRRTTLQTMNLCLTVSWRRILVSRTALRELDALWALPVYPVFEGKKVKNGR